MEIHDRARLNLESLEDRATPAVTSLFTSGLEGWTTLRGDGNAAGATGLQWQSTGGHPGGYIRAADVQDGKTWYWQAPAKFRGDRLAALGTYLTFNQRVSITTSPYNAADVVLAGGGIKLTLDMPKNPKTTWTAYAVQLSAGGGWRVAGTTRAPTAAEFRQVLGNVTHLFIRGEFSSDKGACGLDGVVLGAAAPTVSVNSVSKKEGQTGTTAFAFTVSLSHILPVGASVHYSTANGTATAGSDYTAVGDTVLTFNAGETAKTVTVKVKGERAVEAKETFAVKLTTPSANVKISQATGTGTILNDD